MITGVSGGSFTALAYGLYGDKLFDDYEQRFLKRDVQGELIARALNPFYWGALSSPEWGRSELAAQLYDEILFNGATFGDLDRGTGPFIVASATDIASGGRIPFNQNIFNVLCSDLNAVPLSRAAAASSAVPVVLSPVTINNYGGTCNDAIPPWARMFMNSANPPRPAARAIRELKEIEPYTEGTTRPYIHLVDGGVSDNVGMRGVLDVLELLEALHDAGLPTPLDHVKRIVVFVVNSLSSPPITWDESPTPPGTVDVMLKAVGVPIDHYSYEAVELLKDIAARWETDRRVRQLAGCSTNKDAPICQTIHAPDAEIFAIDVSFAALADPAERAFLNQQPTSFVLTAEAVDRLRKAAGTIIQASPEFQRLLKDVGAKSSRRPPARRRPRPDAGGARPAGVARVRMPGAPRGSRRGCLAAGRRRRRATRDLDVDRDDVGDAAEGGVALAEDAARAAAVAHRDDELRIGRRVVGPLQRDRHVLRDRAGHQQQVGVARARDELDAETFDVVVRIAEGVDLELAAVARAGVDLADRAAPVPASSGSSAAAWRRRPCRRRRGRRFGLDARLRDLAEYVEHSASPQRSCPLYERLNDLLMSGKVGNDVADHRVLEDWPVGPRRVVGVAAPDRAAGPALERDHDRAAPAFDQPDALAERRRLGNLRRNVAFGERGGDRAHEPQRFLDLVEAHGDARGDVAGLGHGLADLERIVGQRRKIAPEIARLPAGAAGEAGQAELSRELRASRRRRRGSGPAARRAPRRYRGAPTARARASRIRRRSSRRPPEPGRARRRPGRSSPSRAGGRRAHGSCAARAPSAARTARARTRSRRRCRDSRDRRGDWRCARAPARARAARGRGRAASCRRWPPAPAHRPTRRRPCCRPRRGRRGDNR